MNRREIPNPKVTKKDMKHLLDCMRCPSHFYEIFRDVVPVYQDGVEYSLVDMLKPFEKKPLEHKIPAKGVDRDKVTYADYLIPLFFMSYVGRESNSTEVLSEVMGLILKDYGHFDIPDTPEARKFIEDFHDGSWFRAYFRKPWDFTEEDELESQRMYGEYRRLRKAMYL